MKKTHSVMNLVFLLTMTCLTLTSAKPSLNVVSQAGKLFFNGAKNIASSVIKKSLQKNKTPDMESSTQPSLPPDEPSVPPPPPEDPSVPPPPFMISIDCGSSTSSKDENGIDWEGDDKYVQSGEARSADTSNSISVVKDTLRVFNGSERKNCYYVDSIKATRVLVRATFFYGNYDNRNSSPTFSLHFDGNEWSSEVKPYSNDYFYYEVIYVMKRDSISVCVAQTQESQFPFISALEIRSLNSHEPDSLYYNTNDYPLFLLRRVAFASNTSIRYPKDPHDRIWTRRGFGDGLIQVSSDAIVDEDDQTLGDTLLRNAITTSSVDFGIGLSTNLPSIEVPAYIKWYFSEVTELEDGETRSFVICLDDDIISDPISPPPFPKNITMYISNITVSSNNNFSLMPTNDSTLPPLINAMEVFLIGDMLTNGTAIQDIEGLAALQKAFSVLKGRWSGDPCLPSPYSWDWIQCNNDSMPRVTALLLDGYGLSGPLPDFSVMDALTTIYLNNNSLQGDIPDFLGKLPNLKTLNLERNKFSSLPASLSSTRAGLNLTVDAGIPPASATSSSKMMSILELLLCTFISSLIII